MGLTALSTAIVLARLRNSSSGEICSRSSVSHWVYRGYRRPGSTFYRKHTLPGCTCSRGAPVLLEDFAALGNRAGEQCAGRIRLFTACRAHRRSADGGCLRYVTDGRGSGKCRIQACLLERRDRRLDHRARRVAGKREPLDHWICDAHLVAHLRGRVGRVCPLHRNQRRDSGFCPQPSACAQSLLLVASAGDVG